MTEESFKTGDIVALKSGGPDMTVRSVDPDGVACDWFEGKRPRKASYPAAMLKPGGKPDLVTFVVNR
jgi:uncharacterized protein YodC (DUF2158 family)